MSSPAPNFAAAAPKPRAQSAQAGGFAWFLGLLAFAWFVHAGLVLLSAAQLRPLAGRWPALALLLLGLGFASALARRARLAPGLDTNAGAQAGPQPATALLTRCLRVLQLGALLSVVLPLLMAAALPIIAYDAVSYRLPTIAQWLDQGRVAWVVSDDPVRNGYPMGQEAVSAVVAAAFGTLRLAGTTSFLYVVAAALGLAWLARSCGVRASLARASACVWLLVPMVILNAPSGYVDAAFAGACIALFCSAAACATQGFPPWLALTAGMSAAHVLSLKGTGLPFVGVVVLGLAARALQQRQRPSLPSAVLFAGAAAPGLFWTLRNVVHTGNPLWPIQVRVAGHVLLPGVGTAEQILDVAANTPRLLAAHAALTRVLLTWLQWQGSALNFDYRLAGLGWTWSFLAVPALALGLWRSLRAWRTRRATPREAGAAPASLSSVSSSVSSSVFVLVLLLTAACLVLQPMTWWSRYTLWLWGAGALAIARELERLARSGRTRLLQAALCTLTVLGVGEAAYALGHVQGLDLAVYRRWRAPAGSAAASGTFLEQLDLRHALQAKRWIAPEFWTLGLPQERQVCRGAWKPMTDNANLDGVFAQFSPRPSVHVVPDEHRTWAQTREDWRQQGCPTLLLFRGSPVLPEARQDPEVSVKPARAFDALFVLRRVR